MTHISYNQLFARLEQIEPRAELEQAIIERIHRLRQRQARLRAGMHILLAIAAGASLAPEGARLMHSAADSGFLQFVSLAWSDGLSVLDSWKSFALTVAESAPLFEMTVTLGLILLCGHSLRRSIQCLKRVETTRVSFFDSIFNRA